MKFKMYRFFVRLAYIRSGGSGRINIFDEIAATLYEPEFDDYL